MKPVGVFYATREGQTEKIAEYLAAGFRTRGLDTELRNLADPIPIDPAGYRAIVLAASVHAGKHEREMVKFVKTHRAALDQLPAGFISVTLSEAGAERVTATAAERAHFAKGVQYCLDRFFKETGWRPERVKPVAGALVYSKYNFIVRFVMKRIAKKAGADTDTSQDYEYTNWAGLDRFMEEFCDELQKRVLAAG